MKFYEGGVLHSNLTVSHQTFLSALIRKVHLIPLLGKSEGINLL